MTIKAISNHYIVTYPCGRTIRCHNLATAQWYVRQGLSSIVLSHMK